MSKSFTLICNDCGHSLPQSTFGYLCPKCESKQSPNSPPLGVFKTVYPYQEIRENYPQGHLFSSLKERQFIDLLPINSAVSLGQLKVGDTPLYTFSIEGDKGREFTFYLKDDSQNPTFSFKDRASQLVSAYAKEQGFNTIVAASTGNAGSSLAGICASQKQKAIIIVPKTAPAAKLLQIVMYGATPVLVDGNYDAAFELSLQATKHFGWFNRNTAYNPFTIEGKKTVAFEIYDQLRCNFPSRIFVSVGDGVIISGVYKGFEDLLELGLIDTIPVIVAVQSDKSDNLIRNMDSDIFGMNPATTIADSISVDYPRNFFMAKSYLKKYKGEWLTVTDEEIINAASVLAKNTGIFAEPAAAAAMAGMLKYAKDNDMDKQNPMLVLSTGSGLKDAKTPLQNITLPQPLKPNIEDLSDYIAKNI
jgi:threonine synthase